ncbi:MAG: DUF835 domain-containing protein [Theionarchaea archaeon]|nr:MAG: hypothetical protein AYK19_06685 [Theionarchaea archaeon DG-70-1]MBU7029424.1 DUF835 domain-containing protein [Theionarchaea archaeon]
MFGLALVSGRIVALIVVAVAVVIWLLVQVRKKIPFGFADDFGTSYVLKTKDSRKAYETYRELKEKHSREGMVVSRVFPDRLSRRYGLKGTAFLWLSYEKTENSIDPSDLEKLEFLIHDFISSHKGAVVLLDGVEYLILQNSFESALKFLQSLNDRIILNMAALIIPLDPASVEKKELSLLERELDIYQVDYRLMRFFE